LENPTRRPWILLAPAVALVGLGTFVAVRFWLTDAPRLPAFGRDPMPRFEPLPRLAERPPDAPRLEGRVVGPDGTAVVDALVYARPSDVPTWDITDLEGRFELDWPLASADRGADEGTVEVEVDVAAWGWPTTTETVAWGAESLEVRLPQAEEPTPRLPDVEASTLEGLVVPSLVRAGGPSLDLELWLEPVDPPDVFSPAVSRRMRCAPHGGFLLDKLAHGRYRAHVLPGWAAGGSWPDLLGEAAVVLEHPGAAAGELLLELADGAIHGTVLDAEGVPLEGALAMLADATRPERLWPPCVADAEGRFRFGDLPMGTYRLVVAAGEARHEENSIEVAAGMDVELPLPPLAPRTHR